MNPDSKMLLQEIQRLFTEENAKLDDANSDLNMERCVSSKKNMERCNIYGMY